MAVRTNSVVGFLSMRGRSAYGVSGNILMSPEYFWLSTARSLVIDVGKTPSSERMFRRWRVSVCAKVRIFVRQVEVGSGVGAVVKEWGEEGEEGGSVVRKGTTCGF